MFKSFKQRVRTILTDAEVGLTCDEPNHIVIHDERFYWHAILGGQTAILDSYAKGWWDTDNLVEVMMRVALSGAGIKTGGNVFWIKLQDMIGGMRQNILASLQVGKKHYDDLTTILPMLGIYKLYSCAYLEHTKNLNKGQYAKVMLVKDKAGLTAGMSVADIGCGMGETGKILGELGIDYTGITIAVEQYEYAKKLCAHLPNVRFLLQDYRKHEGTYDAVISIGMAEHVGRHNFRTYLKKIQSLLKREGGTKNGRIVGRAVIHTIANDHLKPNNPWIEKNVFPGGDLPTIGSIVEAARGIFKVYDFHEFGRHYDTTLTEWLTRYDEYVANLSEEERQRTRRDIRIRHAYLALCIVGFRLRYTQLWQLVLTPEDMYIPNYEPVR